jgi:hypothetical protein
MASQFSNGEFLNQACLPCARKRFEYFQNNSKILHLIEENCTAVETQDNENERKRPLAIKHLYTFL